MEPDRVNQALTAFLVKERVLGKIMEARITFRKILSRSEGAAEEAANTHHHHRHLIIKQGDGRYLYMEAVTNREVTEALADSLAINTANLDREELREELDQLVTAEIVDEGYALYLKPNEDLRSMGLEDKVSLCPISETAWVFPWQWCSMCEPSTDQETKVDLCAHGRLRLWYTRPTVPRNAVPSPAPAHDSDSSPAPSDVWGDIDLSSVLATPAGSHHSAEADDV